MYYRTKYQVARLFKFQLTNYTQRKLKRILASGYRYKIQDFRVLTAKRQTFLPCLCRSGIWVAILGIYT